MTHGVCRQAAPPVQPRRRHPPAASPSALPRGGHRHTRTGSQCAARRGAAAGSGGSRQRARRPRHTAGTFPCRRTVPARRCHRRRQRWTASMAPPPDSPHRLGRWVRDGRSGTGADRRDQCRRPPSDWLRPAAIEPSPFPCLHRCESCGQPSWAANSCLFQAGFAVRAQVDAPGRQTYPPPPRRARSPSTENARVASPVNRPPRPQSVKRSCSSTAISPGPNCMRSRSCS